MVVTRIHLVADKNGYRVTMPHSLPRKQVLAVIRLTECLEEKLLSEEDEDGLIAREVCAEGF